MKYIKLFLFMFLGLFIFNLDVKADGCSVTCYYELYKNDEPDYLLAKFKVSYDGVNEPKFEMYDEAYGVNDSSITFGYTFVAYPDGNIPLNYLQKNKDDPTLHCPNLYYGYKDSMNDAYSVSFIQTEAVEYDEDDKARILEPTQESVVDDTKCKSNETVDGEYELLPYCSYYNSKFKENFNFQIRRNKSTKEVDIINVSHNWTGVNYNVNSTFEFLNFKFECPNYISFEHRKLSSSYFYIKPSDSKTDWSYGGEPDYSDDNKLFTSYVEYTGTNRLQCSKDDVTIISCRKDGKIIEFGNIDYYRSQLEDYNVENYPMYIVEYKNTDGLYGYKFSDKPDSTANSNYICLAHIGNIYINGKDFEETCNGLFGDNFLTFLNNTVFKFIYIGVPIVLIILTTFDFAKVVFIDDKDGIMVASKKFGKRLIASLLIYLVPTILIFISNIMANNEVEQCAQTLKSIAIAENS